MNRKAVIVTTYFPPSSRAGVHRARYLARYLPDAGWQPIVLCVAPEHYHEKLDNDLAAMLPDGLELHSVAALPLTLTRLFGIGDLGLRAYPFLKRALRELVIQERPDVVFLTGAPFYPLTLSVYLKRHFPQVKVVVDLQDPWVSEYGGNSPFYSKRGLAYRIARRLEPPTLRAAAGVTSVSPSQNEALMDRYEFLSERSVAAFPIGGDPQDFIRLREHPPAHQTVVLSKEHINFCFVGAYMPRTWPLMNVFFRGVKTLLEKQPELRDTLRLNFVGTSNLPLAVAEKPVLKLASEVGIEACVFEYPQRVAYLEALQLLSSAHAALLIGSDERHYTASKIYPGLMSGRPYLAMFHRASSSYHLLTKAGGGLTFGFETREELESLVSEVAAAMSTLVNDSASLGSADPGAYESLTAEAVSAGFAAFFEEVIDRE